MYIESTFSSSLEVSVMNLTKSSQPEDTETVDVLASISALVDILISSLRPATVPAKGVKRCENVREREREQQHLQ